MNHIDPASTDSTIAVDEHDLQAMRRAKLDALRAQGNAYPNDFRRDRLAHEIHQQYTEHDAATLESQPIRVRLAGRMMTRRIMGKAAFAHLQDMSGQIQLYLRQGDLPDGVYEAFKHWDIGDIVGVAGMVFKTKTGELSIKVDEIRLLTKSLRPLPEKWHGLADTETRYRQRYLDLIMNEDSRRVFHLRSRMIAAIRHFLEARGFLEVETPMMHPIPGGATARPFVTHHNALNMELFLRVAPELYLKRLVVGGFEKVFEINRNFRNEGLSTRHNPEFTMLEFYLAYADYHMLMDLTEEMFRAVAQELLGSAQIPYTLADDQQGLYDFDAPFTRMTLVESIAHFHPDISLPQLHDLEFLRSLALALKIHTKPNDGAGKLQQAIFEETVEHRLIQPTFITAYPTETSPLARRNDDNPAVTDRFELFIGGREIANGFSELNDADDQAERFRQQVADKDAGDLEAMHYDEDYIRALEHGLPPTAGEGIGIDRLAMLLTNTASIRDVLLFPQLRRKEL